ncbi:hypothetical protein Hs30E_15480 [Lactococcus hodotermopsidis]|uniref:Uncharacterized protein n=1 Tax=Pseudolactococcus hodotermopsidis TaxID=2709157 RepID=A0A6A0BGT7_9LACT|nr:hypothetical protein [Lactococcus hodotermopsidis]GFH42997.1 hypothetical protein Hs30E_15480 [Lactococcus hodotermopsidis]
MINYIKYFIDRSDRSDCLSGNLKKNLNIVSENITHFLELSNHELLTRSDGTQIIVEKNISATAVAQIVSETDENVALKILEYNWFSNQGNLESKQLILKQIADYLEPQRKEMSSSNLSDILNVKNRLLPKIKKFVIL